MKKAVRWMSLMCVLSAALSAVVVASRAEADRAKEIALTPDRSILGGTKVHEVALLDLCNHIYVRINQFSHIVSNSKTEHHGDF